MIASVGHCGISGDEYEVPTPLWDEKKSSSVIWVAENNRFEFLGVEGIPIQ